MDNCVKQIYSSELFKKLLIIILAIGNYMNGNTIAGGAFGFKIMGLPTIIDCRSPAISKITLLHYTLSFICEHYPDVKAFTSEFSLIEEASRFDIGPIVTELNEEIAPAVTNIKAEMEQAKKLEDTQFLSSFEPFYEKAIEALKETRELARKLNSDFDSLIFYFAEEKKITFKELITALKTFCSQFDKAIEDNATFAKQEAKRQQLKEVELSKDSERGILDSALDHLRRGNRIAVQDSN